MSRLNFQMNRGTEVPHDNSQGISYQMHWNQCSELEQHKVFERIYSGFEFAEQRKIMFKFGVAQAKKLQLGI